MKRSANSDKAEIIIKRSKRAASKKPVSHHYQGVEDIHEGQKVSLIIGEETGIGFKAVINNSIEGILYKSEVFQPLKKGQKTEGFIKKIREDKKIDLCLYKPGYKKVETLSERIIERIKEAGGFIPVTDKSAPGIITELFGVSKKAYKMGVGRLYKKRLIAIEDDGIRLINKTHPPSSCKAGLRRAKGVQGRKLL